MKKIYLLFAIALSLGASHVSFSATPTQSLGACLVDSLNGKERKQLAKWIYFAIAAHPEISDFSKASSKDIDSTDQYIGGLVTRLLTVDCPTEMKLANDLDPLAMQQAFELVGQVAMQELMTNENVMSSITGYIKYADMDKINSLLIGK